MMVLDIIDNMCELTWHGTDADIETSLLEYGLLCKYNTQNKEYDVIVPSPYIKDKYDSSSITEYRVNTILDDDLSSQKNGFLQWLGEDSIEEWCKNRFVNKLHDLCTFFGSESILGADYYPETLEELCEREKLDLIAA